MTTDAFKDLRTWATVRQLEFIEAIEKHGSKRAAAVAIGLNESTIRNSLESLAKRAARMGHSPKHDMTHSVPDGYQVKGVSTYYDKDGKPAGQWVKSAMDPDRQEEIRRAAIEAFTEDVGPLAVQPWPVDWQSDVIPWIQIGDAHIGLLAHANEVGENFNIKIAEAELCGAIGILIDELPNCERLVINDLGDGTHIENFEGRTEASGHILDHDSRFPKVIKAYSRIMRFIVEKALTKARHVDVIVNQGNHSRTNDIWMAELLRVAYGHTGRVHVLNNDSVFIAYRMGNTLVMTHHSDKCKPTQLAHVMTNDFRKDYGETEFHYVDVGHVHHGMVLKEHPGIFVESFNHLASLDRWAHDSGYRNRKSITIVLRSRRFGEVGRRVLPIQEIRSRLDKASGAGVAAEREVFTV
jgi:hypothetical protein